jgi:PIN domain nuclease of toxin-antitoxin system
MRALLDTSSFLWFIAGSDSLSIKARDLIVDHPTRHLKQLTDLLNLS